MKIKWNNDTLRRVISDDDTCAGCCRFEADRAGCNPDFIDLCLGENIYYILQPCKYDDPIFLI
jgi:hypothetical protein